MGCGSGQQCSHITHTRKKNKKQKTKQNKETKKSQQKLKILNKQKNKHIHRKYRLYQYLLILPSTFDANHLVRML